MSRLIVLSNRVTTLNNDPKAGGLAVALQQLLADQSGIWMGWNGEVIDIEEAADAGEFNNVFCSHKACASKEGDAVGVKSPFTYITTGLTLTQYQYYYCGFANNVLWPLLHERVDLIHQASSDYEGYQAVNRLFAHQLTKILRPDDVIWVHDYHFLSVAYYCRQLGIHNRIGFFLHIPFAPLACWQQLDKSEELICHLAYYDLVGTQTSQDKTNCLSVIQHYLKDYCGLQDYCDLQDYRVKQSLTPFNQSAPIKINLNLPSKLNHALAINDYPIGVNVARIQQQVSELSSRAQRTTVTLNPGKFASQRIIAVDRIDYSKGLLARFSAYRDFLQQYPRYQNQLNLLQIACPSRLDLPAYQQLYNQVRQTVININQQFISLNDVNKHLELEDSPTAQLTGGNINLDHPKENWQAVTYSETAVSHETLMKLFWQSDVGWVNSLKDGMNLVAKEYVAAQDPDNPGVLLLSRYAGAAEQMSAAVIIDPHQPTSIMDGLKQALQMPLTERQSRYQELIQGLQQEDLAAWHQRFLEDLNRMDNIPYQQVI